MVMIYLVYGVFFNVNILGNVFFLGRVLYGYISVRIFDIVKYVKKYIFVKRVLSKFYNKWKGFRIVI